MNTSTTHTICCARNKANDGPIACDLWQIEILTTEFFKKNSGIAAKELNAEKNSILINEVISSALNG